MKVYTKKGDKGKTDLLYKRVSKSDLNIEIIGTIDELNAYLSFAHSILKDTHVKYILLEIMKDTSAMMHEVSSDVVTNITKEKITELEEFIDEFEEKMEPLKNFIYFTSDPASATINVARTVTRKLERRLVQLDEQAGVEPNILAYVNRLSDLLFVLARFIRDFSKEE